jgi:hypothetical protein
MGDMQWTGTKEDRSFTAGQTISYALCGPAADLVARLQQIIADHPDLDPRDLRGNLMLHVAPGLASIYDDAIARGDWEDQ